MHNHLLYFFRIHFCKYPNAISQINDLVINIKNGEPLSKPYRSIFLNSEPCLCLLNEILHEPFLFYPTSYSSEAFLNLFYEALDSIEILLSIIPSDDQVKIIIDNICKFHLGFFSYSDVHHYLTQIANFNTDTFMKLLFLTNPKILYNPEESNIPFIPLNNRNKRETLLQFLALGGVDISPIFPNKDISYRISTQIEQFFNLTANYIEEPDTLPSVQISYRDTSFFFSSHSFSNSTASDDFALNRRYNGTKSVLSSISDVGDKFDAAITLQHAISGTEILHEVDSKLVPLIFYYPMLNHISMVQLNPNFSENIIKKQIIENYEKVLELSQLSWKFIGLLMDLYQFANVNLINQVRKSVFNSIETLIQMNHMRINSKRSDEKESINELIMGIKIRQSMLSVVRRICMVIFSLYKSRYDFQQNAFEEFCEIKLRSFPAPDLVLESERCQKDHIPVGSKTHGLSSLFNIVNNGIFEALESNNGKSFVKTVSDKIAVQIAMFGRIHRLWVFQFHYQRFFKPCISLCAAAMDWSKIYQHIINEFDKTFFHTQEKYRKIDAKLQEAIDNLLILTVRPKTKTQPKIQFVKISNDQVELICL